MSRASSAFFFLRFPSSLPPELLLFSYFISAGVADSLLGDFILKVGARVIWKELKRTWETR
jgi:hypothetical protein